MQPWPGLQQETDLRASGHPLQGWGPRGGALLSLLNDRSKDTYDSLKVVFSARQWRTAARQQWFVLDWVSVNSLSDLSQPNSCQLEQ